MGKKITKKPSSGGGLTSLEDVSVGDVTSKIFPEGIPTNDDGTVVSEAEIPVAKAAKVGADNPESAKRNKEFTRRIKAAQDGGKWIRWGSHDAVESFMNMKMFPSTQSINIFIKRVDPDPPVQYPITPLNNYRDAKEFCDWVWRNCHRAPCPASKYEVRYMEGGQERGKGFLYLERRDNESEGPDMNRQPPPIPPYPPHGYPSAGQPYGYPQYPQGYPPPPPGYYPPPQQQPAPGYYPPPPQQQPPQQAPAQQPAPQQQPPTTAQQPEPAQAAPQPQFAPQQPQYPQQQQGFPPYASAPSNTMADQAMAMAAAAFEQGRQTHEMMRQLQLQNERAIAVAEERARQFAGWPTGPVNYAQPPPQPTPPQQQQYAGPPGTSSPGMVGAPPPGVGQWPPQNTQPQAPPAAAAPMQAPVPMGGPPGWMYHPAVGWYQQGAPPPPAAAPAPAPKPVDPMAMIAQAAEYANGFGRTLKQLRMVTNQFENGAADTEEEDPPPPPAPEPDKPFDTMAIPLGDPSRPPFMYAHKKDGSPHLVGTIMANSDKIGSLLEVLGKTIGSVQQQAQQRNAQAAGGTFVEVHQPQSARNGHALPPPEPAYQQPSPVGPIPSGFDSFTGR